jgi:aminoglycoside phosphotransferase (APT) family kinase protein
MAVELSQPVHECSRVLVHGDLSAGNILIDGESVGLVDFEDMGVGPTFRDTLWIRYLFELGNRHFYYRGFNHLSDMLLATESRSEYKIIYQLDFSLLNLLYMQQKHGSLSFWRNTLTAREVRWACSQISKLYQRACKDGLLRPRSPTSEPLSQSGRSAVPFENATDGADG